MSKEYIAFLRKFPVFDYFDEQVVSCEVGMGKPDREIFEYLLSHCGLEASETLFIDDRKDNTDAAAEVGLATLHFDRNDASASCQRLRELLKTL